MNNKTNIIELLKKADLKGRGGAGFPTALKWEMVKQEPAGKKYVVANGSEGEPGVFKDSYILENHRDKLIAGIKIAMKEVGAKTGYVYLRSDLYKKYKAKLESGIGKDNIKVFREDGKYLCGEETVLIRSIEGVRDEPRYKPPFPTQRGLFDCPTLINNIETLYTVALISEGKYQGTRLYSLSGQVQNKGVFELPIDSSLREILKETKNLPLQDYFAMVGGGACGHIVAAEEAGKEIVAGAGAVIIYSSKSDPIKLMKEWTDFFLQRSCGKCVPCREGFYRINELLKNEPIDYPALREMLEVMADTSFCGLGQYAPGSYLTLIEKIIKP